MSVVRGIVIVVGCSVCFGVAGGLLGLTLGVGAPAYYRGVFHAADDPGFNPVHVGLGLGISQGLICGAVIGSVIVLAVALSWASRQKSEPVGEFSPDIASDRTPSAWMRRVLVIVAILAAIAFAGVIGFVAGTVIGQAQVYWQYTDAKLAKIRPVLREREFARVNAEYSSLAHVSLIGTVGSEQAYKALLERMRSLFGDEQARVLMANVEVIEK